MVNVRGAFEKQLCIGQGFDESDIDYKLRIIGLAEGIPYVPDDPRKDKWMKLPKEARDWFNDSVENIDERGGEPLPFPEDELILNEYIDMEETEEAEPVEEVEEIPIVDKDEELLAEDKVAVLTPKERKKVLEVYENEDIRQNVRRSHLEIDHAGYTRVEAFVDALRKGGTKDEIILNSQKNYVAANGEGNVRNIAEATFYFKVLQRLCYRLGLIRFNGAIINFETDELTIIEGLNKVIK